jgi:hypothetical protein
MADGRGILKFVTFTYKTRKTTRQYSGMKRCVDFCYKPMYLKECLSLEFNESKQEIEG